jgi:hypothetical protein
MPTELGDPYMPTWRGKYPHMLKEDVPVWNDFLEENPGIFQRVFYDVRVGGVVPDREQFPDEKMRKMYYDNSAKRIDALCELKDELWLVEVADHPGLRAVGQLQTYVALWFEDPKINKPIKPILVCRDADEDLERSLIFYGMLVKRV